MVDSDKKCKDLKLGYDVLLLSLQYVPLLYLFISTSQTQDVKDVSFYNHIACMYFHFSFHNISFGSLGNNGGAGGGSTGVVRSGVSGGGENVIFQQLAHLSFLCLPSF